MDAAERQRRGVRAVAGLYLFTAGVHVGLVAADPQVYDGFADAALLGWVRDRWQDTFMAHPAGWGLAVAAGELTISLLLATRPRLGLAAAVAFHLALMLFGLGFWLWCLPALALLGVLLLTAGPSVPPARRPTALPPGPAREKARRHRESAI